MSNLYTVLKKILPDAPLQVGVITQVVTGGFYASLPGGVPIFVRGVGSLGQSVFIRDGVIEGVAPSFSVVEIEV